MVKWEGGPLPFKAENIFSNVDKRGCIHHFFLKDGKLMHALRGRRPPYPISEPDSLGDGFCGMGSSFFWVDGFMVFTWPRKIGNAYQMYVDPMKYEDPGTGAIVKLESGLRVPEMVSRFGYPILMSPTFTISYGIEDQLDEALWCEDFLNRGARGGFFNNIRFTSLGVWEDFTFPRMIFPYAYDGNRFDCFNRNPKWMETLDRRIGQLVERGYSVTIILVEGCSLHNHPNSHWALNPWNGNKNINESSPWAGAPWHFYEDEHQGKTGMDVTARIIEDHVRFTVHSLDAKYRPYINWEICNEARAGEGWHSLIRRWLKEEGVADDNRVMTSMDGAEYHPGEFPHLEFYKKQMWQYLRYAAHGVQTIEEYKWMKDNWMPRGINFQASADGLYPAKPPDPRWPPYRDFVRQILEDGALGFEANIRPYHNGNVFDPNLFEWDSIKEIGDGFKDFLK